jgi:hypothetical protein
VVVTRYRAVALRRGSTGLSGQTWEQGLRVAMVSCCVLVGGQAPIGVQTGREGGDDAGGCVGEVAAEQDAVVAGE